MKPLHTYLRFPALIVFCYFLPLVQKAKITQLKAQRLPRWMFIKAAPVNAASNGFTIWKMLVLTQKPTTRRT